ncbi:hypothetical protein Q4575_13040, partial [Psychrosphaera sp. 1_MG-2023]|uniref:hypothetical protein n=1 Tax=Psychrosphaera sp. 1_MG-2023 TaxID=3062643 RepID=UPI0026E42217
MKKGLALNSKVPKMRPTLSGRHQPLKTICLVAGLASKSARKFEKNFQKDLNKTLTTKTGSVLYASRLR